MMIESIAQLGAVGAATTQAPASPQSATDAFGLQFEDLLRIVLTQLTYQDPLKPMESFEFVSQLAQFSQIQQGQTANDRLLALVQAEATNQAASVLGRIVDVPAGAGTLSGRVQSITFASGEPRLTLETSDGRTISNIALSGVTRIGMED